MNELIWIIINKRMNILFISKTLSKFKTSLFNYPSLPDNWYRYISW